MLKCHSETSLLSQTLWVKRYRGSKFIWYESYLNKTLDVSEGNLTVRLCDRLASRVIYGIIYIVVFCCDCNSKYIFRIQEIYLCSFVWISLLLLSNYFMVYGQVIFLTKYLRWSVINVTVRTVRHKVTCTQIGLICSYVYFLRDIVFEVARRKSVINVKNNLQRQTR